MNGVRIDPRAVRTRADLLRLLEADPLAATPALVRRLKERVEELYRTDARAAGELAECVFLVAERCGDLESLALAHRARALATLASGSRRDALAAYEAAERLYRLRGDEVERARVLRSMIDALMHLGRYEEALAAGREAEEIFRRHGLQVLAAQVEANIGSVFHRLDRNPESLEAYERALRTFEAAGEEEAVAMMEFNRANVFANLNELEEARRGYRRALRYYRASGFRLREAQCFYALAYLAYLGSRAGVALRLYDRVKALDLELGDVRHAALCDLDRAEVLLSLNAWVEASGLARAAHAAFEELGMGSEAAKAALFQGLAAAHRGRFEQAAELLRDAARRFERERNEVYGTLTALYRAELALRCGAGAEALALARRAARLFSREGLRTKEAYARVVAARALVGLGRRASARRQCAIALEALRRSPSAWIAYQAHHLLGRLETFPEVARRHLDEALALVERLRANVLPDELRASFQRDKVSIYEDYARLLLEAEGGAAQAPWVTGDAPAAGDDGGHPAQAPHVPSSGGDHPHSPPDGRARAAAGRLAEAFAVLEMAKSRVLSDYLAQTPLDDDSAAGRLAHRHAAGWRRQLEELNACYRRMNEAELGGRPRSQGEALRREIEERETRLASLFRAMQLGRRAREARAPAEDRRTLCRVQELLGADEALVEFFFLGDALQAFVVRRDGIRWIAALAMRAEIREALERWRFQVEKTRYGKEHLAAHRETLRAAALYRLERLAKLVWRPLAASLRGACRLVIVPAGPLFYVPFHALRDGGCFLVERFELSQAASARVYLAAHGLRQVHVGPPLVLGLERPELPSIAAEVAAVSARLPGARVLLGEKARRAALRRFGRGARVVHIASHAAFRGDNPLLSAIELADGRLSFYDLFDLRLDAELVVLSGCQTGEHHILEGDELMGLARGFLYAGAASLVASLWPIEDAAAARFMEGFYARLDAGQGPRAALAGTMRELIARGVDPWDWAPFHLTGRPGPSRLTSTITGRTESETGRNTA